MAMEMTKYITSKGFVKYITSKGETALGDGVHITLAFPNGFGASIIMGRISMGLPELAVLKGGYITYNTPITNDVMRFTDLAQLVDTINQIMNLPEDTYYEWPEPEVTFYDDLDDDDDDCYDEDEW